MWGLAKLFLNKAKLYSSWLNIWRSGLGFFPQKLKNSGKSEKSTFSPSKVKLPAISLGVRCLWKLCKCIPHLQQGTYSIKPDFATAFFQESESKVWTPKFAFDLRKSESRLSPTFASCQQGNLLEIWQGKIWIISVSESSWCLLTAVCHSCMVLISPEECQNPVDLRQEQSWIHI